MHAIEPDMVLGKNVIDAEGGKLGQIVDVGLYTHRRVKFLLVQDDAHRVPIRTFAVDAIHAVGDETVTLRLEA